ncbi:hypothetical protein [Corynebacterium heidelbergense]|uniref:hypothetical protein n=1 Tax=Corynebacterium heidelbergense TaxID=2055947 RepID=UPI0015EEFAB9|nr:hypothetical protein [Corynebacterium heidelbergense]WCZ35907.1 hypothetical protein CHEID_01645 [Corynebacterium heidelbergense]
MTNKYNWLILLVAATIVALIAALGFLQWNVAVWPIGALVVAAALTWLLLRRQHRVSA